MTIEMKIERQVGNEKFRSLLLLFNRTQPNKNLSLLLYLFFKEKLVSEAPLKLK